MRFLFCSLLIVAACFWAGACYALDAVKFATNWKAEAEHGGFYQALADGTYKRYGLDVTILQGGPLVNNRAQLAVGRIEFLMGSNLIQSFDAIKQGLPSVVIAGFFQRDVQCLISHPGQGRDRWEDLKTARLLIGATGKQTYYRWLQSAHDFPSRGIRTYTFSLAPFLADKNLVQQGYMSAEPLTIAKVTGTEPNVFLLADYGWSTYSTLLVTRRKYADENPDIVQRFVDASILGWVNYLYGDPSLAHAAIRRENREMTDEQLKFSRQKMIERGIVDSGDTLTKGIGALSQERVNDFHSKMVAAGLYKPGEVDLSQVCRFEFVNKGVGVEEKAQLVGSGK
ncbi:MAG: ABC transporter substrate-binding protein [Planctomycetota bacterium]